MLQRRSQASSLFEEKTTEAYVDSFGDYDGDFWLGSAIVYGMTAGKPHMLMFELTYRSGKKYLEYGGFSLYMKKSRYRLRLGMFLGGDAVGMCFIVFI